MSQLSFVAIVLMGQGTDGSLTLMTADGKAVLIPGGDILAHIISKISLMPEGLENALTIQDFRHLLAFLLSRK